MPSDVRRMREKLDLRVSATDEASQALQVRYLAEVVLALLPETDRILVRRGLQERGLQVSPTRPALPE